MKVLLRCVAPFVLGCLALGGCADDPEAVTGEPLFTDVPTQHRTETGNSVPRLFDEAIPIGRGPISDYLPFNNPAQLAEASVDVFIGRFVDIEESVRTLDFSADPESASEGSGLPVVEYDGLVFEIDEVLQGDLEPGSVVAVAVAAVQARDGELQRLQSDHLRFVDLSDLEEQNRFLVFTVVQDDLRFFNTPAGIVEIAEDGLTLLEAAQGPFAFGNYQGGAQPHSETLDTVRIWIAGGNPVQGPPPEAIPQPGDPLYGPGTDDDEAN